MYRCGKQQLPYDRYQRRIQGQQRGPEPRATARALLLDARANSRIDHRARDSFGRFTPSVIFHFRPTVLSERVKQCSPAGHPPSQTRVVPTQTHVCESELEYCRGIRRQGKGCRAQCQKTDDGRGSDHYAVVRFRVRGNRAGRADRTRSAFLSRRKRLADSPGTM